MERLSPSGRVPGGGSETDYYMKRFFLLTAILLAVVSTVRGGETLSGVWRTHQGAARQLATMAATPNHLYAMIHSQEFRHANAADYSIPKTTVFVVRESDPDPVPLSQLVSLSGPTPAAMRYSPVSRKLVIAYADGAVDIVTDHDDGTLTARNASALLLTSTPGDHTVLSVTVDASGRTAWLATASGFATIDLETLKTNYTDLGHQIDEILAVTPERLVAVSGRQLYECPTPRPADWSSFTPLKLSEGELPEAIIDDDGMIRTGGGLFPIANGVFAFVGLNSGSSIRHVVVTALRADGWEGEVYIEDSLRFQYMSSYLSSMGELTAYPNRDGLSVAARNFTYQILADADWTQPLSTLKESQVRSRILPGDDRGLDFTTWDFGKHWFYEPFNGLFSRRCTSGDGSQASWEERGALHRPNAPTASISPDIVYSSRYGLLLQNHGIDLNFQTSGASTPSTLCGYRDGCWTALSPAWATPSFFKERPELATSYNDLRQMYPVSNPKGIEIDPDYPDYVWIGSQMGGIARLNMADPTAPVLHLSTAADRFKDWPGFIDFAPVHEAWPGFCSFSAPRFDGEGNLWAGYYDLTAEKRGESKITLRVWPRQDRLDSWDANTDPSKFKPWKELYIRDIKSSNTMIVLPLKHKANNGLVIVGSMGYDSPLVVYDRGADPEDPSDDEQHVFEILLDVKGSRINKQRILQMREDPQTGLVWVCTFANIFYFDPVMITKRNSVVVQPRPLDPESGSSPVLLSGVQVNDIAFDSEGRKWIATNGEGVLCLSSDLSRILGHWTTENSPLQSDRVYGIGCDQRDGNVLFSTDLGNVEFIPDGARKLRSPYGTPRVSPTPVTPDFKGMVSISGLTPGARHNVVDREGRIVQSIVSSDSGHSQWDACDPEGLRCPSGRYTVILPDRPEAPCAEVIVLE